MIYWKNTDKLIPQWIKIVFNIMRDVIKKYHSYYDWILKVSEERLVEQKLLKEHFDSREEFMVFLVVTLRFSKKLLAEAKDSFVNKI